MSNLFEGCSNLEKIYISSSFDTSNVKDMKCMFKDCEKLVRLYISNFIINEETEFEHMFDGCTKLKKIYLEKEINTSKIHKALESSKIKNVKFI